MMSKKGSKKEFEDFNHHISSIFKINGKEHYLTVSLNRRGEGHVDLSNEDDRKPLFHAGTFDKEFTDVITDATPIFVEIRKFLRLIEGKLENKKGGE